MELVLDLVQWPTLVSRILNRRSLLQYIHIYVYTHIQTHICIYTNTFEVRRGWRNKKRIQNFVRKFKNECHNRRKNF
jgi:ribonucleotide reductase beta subunit family protein with ferritin-like domain